VPASLEPARTRKGVPIGRKRHHAFDGRSPRRPQEPDAGSRWIGRFPEKHRLIGRIRLVSEFIRMQLG
jgi:hypothetical protein